VPAAAAARAVAYSPESRMKMVSAQKMQDEMQEFTCFVLKVKLVSSH